MDFKEIDYAVMEATMNVVASRVRYRSKQRLIEDINNDEWISEEEYHDLSNIDDDVITEYSTTIGGVKYDIDDNEYIAYRFDPWTHNVNVGKYNRSVAELAVAVYQASHTAKGINGVPLKSLISKRCSKIEKIAKKRYIGKHEALCDLVQMVQGAKNNCFMTISSIVGLGHVKNNDNEIDPDLVWVSFFVKLPKAPLTIPGYILCKTRAEYKTLNEKIKRLGQQGELMYKDQVNALLSKIRKLEGIVHKEIGGYFTKNYCDDVCFFNSSGLQTMVFAEHMRRKPDNGADINDKIEEISKMETKDKEFMRASNNKACVDLMAAVYAFTLE